MSSLSYREHYEKYIPVYEDLAYANGGKTVWIPTDDHDGWYITEPVQDENSRAWKEGFPNKSKPSILPDNLSSDVERTAYTTISYAPDESYEPAYYKETEDGIEWMDGNSDRLPDYGSITAWALFVDIDIHKKYKKRPLPDTHKEVIEQRLSLWIDAFTRMAGSPESVMSLDSGGGMYVFVPPCSMSPVSDRYNEEEKNLIFNEIGTRMRTVTGKLDELICQEDNAPDELFSADKVQNKNRQFKTLGSIHKDLDSVVHPVDTNEVDIEYKPVESIGEKDIKNAMEWSEKFTSEEHRDCVDSIIKYLFQGQFTKNEDMDISYVDGNTWEEILDNWVEDKKESIQMWEEAQSQRSEMSEEKLRTELTQDKEVATEALRRVNNRKLKKYIVNFLGTGNVYEKSGEEMDFFPFWRGESTESGRSAFYDYYEGKARFTDKADGTSRDIVYWVALEMTYDDENYPDTELLDAPGDDLDGADYRRCIDELRNRGEDIPILVQELEEDEKLPPYQVRSLGFNLGLVSDEDIVTENGDKRVKPSTWNDILDRLAAEGIEHNQDYRNPLSIDDIKPPETEQILQDYDKQGRMRLIFSNSGYYQDEFSSRNEYENFIQKLPKYVVLFKYGGDKIAGGNPEGLLAGAFGSQDETTIVLNWFEPMVMRNIDNIETYEDLTIQTNERLEKENIKIYISQDNEDIQI